MCCIWLLWYCVLRAVVPAAAQLQQVLQQQFNGDMGSPSHSQQQALHMDLQLEHNSQVRPPVCVTACVATCVYAPCVCVCVCVCMCVCV